jgi:hypothetical protein
MDRDGRKSRDESTAEVIARSCEIRARGERWSRDWAAQHAAAPRQQPAGLDTSSWAGGGTLTWRPDLSGQISRTQAQRVRLERSSAERPGETARLTVDAVTSQNPRRAFVLSIENLAGNDIG